MPSVQALSFFSLYPNSASLLLRIVLRSGYKATYKQVKDIWGHHCCVSEYWGRRDIRKRENMVEPQ